MRCLTEISTPSSMISRHVLHGENAPTVHGSPVHVRLHREPQNKPWLKRSELQDRDSDPSVLDMIKSVQPLMGPLQEKLDRLLYPNAGEDAAIVRELLAR